MEKTRILIRTIDGKKKLVGILEGTTFKKKVRKSDHLYRVLDAWGIDAKVFTDILCTDKCSMIIVEDEEDGSIYKVVPRRFKEHGQYKHHKPHRAQIFLPRRFWVKEQNVNQLSLNI